MVLYTGIKYVSPGHRWGILWVLSWICDIEARSAIESALSGLFRCRQVVGVRRRYPGAMKLLGFD